MSSNFENIKRTEFKNTCRTCLFNCELKTIQQDNIIIQILHNLGVRIEANDELPQQICRKCFEKIHEIHVFALQCKQTYSILRKSLNNCKNTRIIQEKRKIVEDTNKPVKIVGDTNDPVKIIGDTNDSVKIVGDTNKPVKIVEDTNEPVKIKIKEEINEPKVEFVPVNNYFGGESTSTTTNFEIKQELIEDIKDIKDEIEDDMFAETSESNNEQTTNEDDWLIPNTQMDSNDSETEKDDLMGTPPEIREAASVATCTLLPTKSKSQYERQYKLFMDWRLESKTDSFSEIVLLAYFQNLSTKMKPSSLWAIYSMLRMTINLKNNIDISKYPKLCAFLKRTSNGYKPKKSSVLTPEQIQDFLLSAPDETYLFTKVGLIFGMMGACRRKELMKIETSHVEDLQTALLVHIPDGRNKTERQFAIGGSLYNICKKYMALRPPDLENVTRRFFLNFQRGKCTKQPVGINKFGSIASHVAAFLQLPDASSYTGHCFRRPSATILVDSGLNTTPLKRAL